MDDADLRSQFHGLAQLLGAYLNQDYTINGPDLEDSVYAFIDDSNADEIAEVRADIARFLDLRTNDLDATLYRFSHGDHAQEPGMGAREYLLWIDGLLAKAA